MDCCVRTLKEMRIERKRGRTKLTLTDWNGTKFYERSHLTPIGFQTITFAFGKPKKECCQSS